MSEIKTERKESVLKPAARIRPYLPVIILMLLSFCLIFSVRLLPEHTVIGDASSPGLLGEIFFQKNMVRGFEEKRYLNYFNTVYTNYPFSENLGFRVANSLHLLLCIPLKFFFGPASMYNAMIVLIFLFNFLAAYILSKHLFKIRSIAICSATIFALNSYVLLKLNLGFVQKFCVFWLPLYMMELLRIPETRKWKDVLWASGLLVFMQFTYPPYAYFAVIFTFFWACYLLMRQEKFIFVFSRLVTVLFVLLAVTYIIYFFLGFKDIYLDPGSLGVGIVDEGNLDIFKPFKFFPYRTEYYPVGLPIGLSFTAFIVGILALIKRRGFTGFLFFAMLMFVLFAAGPYLRYKGALVEIAGHSLPLPFYFLVEHMFYAGGIYFPIRVFPFINLNLALLAGFGLQIISSKLKEIKLPYLAGIFLILYLSEHALLFPSLFPPKISLLPIPAAYSQNREDLRPVLNLPVTDNRKAVNLYGFYSAVSGRKMMNPYNIENLKIYIPKTGDPVSVKEAFIDFLSDSGVGLVVLHLNFFLPEFTEDHPDDYEWMAEFCDLEALPDDGLVVYRLSGEQG